MDKSKWLTLRLSEAAGAAPGFGHKIWPSAHTLVAHLAARDDIAGKRVVELGCGVGLVGVAVAALGARTVLTDRDAHVLSQAAANIQLNQTALAKADGSAVTFRLDWRDDAALHKLLHLHGPFDLIVASDVLYSASMFPSLLHTIDALSTVEAVGTQPTTTTLLAYPDRDNRYVSCCHQQLAQAVDSRPVVTLSRVELRPLFLQVARQRRRLLHRDGNRTTGGQSRAELGWPPVQGRRGYQYLR